MNKLPHIAIFLSGKGSNFSSILRAIVAGDLKAKVSIVISNTSEAGGLRTAGENKIPAFVLERAAFSSGEEFGEHMLRLLRSHDVDLIVLAGYLRKIPPLVIRAFPKRIVNIHPALLPKYGGKGMYGHFVHEAVIANGDSESGVTIHYVDEIYDNGEIIAQRSLTINPGETPESLAARILEIEHQFYPEVLQQLLASQAEIISNE